MDKYTSPDFNRCAVITIDTQNDFSLPGAIAEIKGTDIVIPAMKRILDTCRNVSIPIVHVIRIYEENGSNADLCRRELIESGAAIVRPGSIGADLVNEIKPASAEALDYESLLNGTIQLIGPLEWVLYKPRWGAFYRTDLEKFLRDRGIDTLIFIGCNFPNCPRTSLYEASERDFKILMVEDAISGVYDQGIEEIGRIGVQVVMSDQLITRLESR